MRKKCEKYFEKERNKLKIEVGTLKEQRRKLKKEIKRSKRRKRNFPVDFIVSDLGKIPTFSILFVADVP